ncbi:MAG: major capsid protein [Muribaculaceae bacterium]|nr:major capsid protein [Muribaculaceae bacterium]MCM1399872.1 major capsid protein [Clostridium sp.]MCM1460643.1 major capsid protein [Bacteroides sp.]
MALFDAKNFNGEVFGAYVEQTENLNRNELLKSGAIVEKPQYAAMLPDQVGGNYITVPIKAKINGDTVNYDGGTDIKAVSRATYTHGRIVVGRAQGWTEKDFTSDITGEDFLPAANEIAEFWDDVDQKTILAVLKGVFSMTDKKSLEFVNGHTYDISNEATGNTFDETTLNTAMQQALGDNKAKFSCTIMHSAVATHLENLKLLAYMKYTDKDGIERDLALATLNGRTVLVDDNMPTEVVEAVEGNESEGIAAQEGYTKYTTYVLGNGAIEYTNCGAKKPYSMSENESKNGGETTLWSRQRKIFSPYGISFKNTNIMSPTDAQLEDGKNWTLANSNEGDAKASYFPHKAIPIARIITRG